MSKEDFREEHMVDLKGKDYLPVAPRVVLFRADHPNWSIVTEPVQVGDEWYIRAAVTNENGDIQSTAHKRVRKNGKGPAAEWPLETAETGAVGRALALCGYGTLAGDLDEGDEIADAPQEPKAKARGKTAKKDDVASPAPEPSDTDGILAAFKGCKSLAELRAARVEALKYTGTLEKGHPDREKIADAYDKRKEELGPG